MADYEIFDIPKYTLQSGVTLDLKLSYKTYGKLSKARDNVIVIPAFYGGRHSETEYMLAQGRAIDTRKYFVVIPNMFGNGCSSSPHNTPAPYGRGAFPLVDLYDNVICQHKLLTDHLKVRKIRLVAGSSMGGMQSFQYYFLQNDANNLLAMASTWLQGDISANPVFKGDFKRALAAIKCPAIVMPGTTDLYFRVADNEAEVRLMPSAECRPIPSVWGHGAGFGLSAPDNAFVDKALRELRK